MTGEDLIAQLKAGLPEDLARELVEQFMTIRRDTVTVTLERSSPGKFVETVVQVLQQLERGTYDATPKVDDYLKNLESRAASLPDDLRLVTARVARAMYTLRSKRGIVHKSGIEPHIYDLRYLYTSAQWVLSEVLRHTSGSDAVTASRLVAFIQLPADALVLVEDFGDRRLVLTGGTANEELLVLLRHYYPENVIVSQIHKDMDRRNRSTVSNSIRAAWEKKLIEGDRSKGFKLTRTGHGLSTELVRTRLNGE